jgi:hypothetical protein
MKKDIKAWAQDCQQKFFQPYGLGLALFLVFFLKFFDLSGRHAPSPELDPSWSLIMEQAFRAGRLWGSEIIFTFGPLGWLFPAHSFGHLAELRLAAALLFAGATAWAIVWAVRHLSIIWGTVFGLWAFVFLNGMDPRTLFFFLVAGYVLTRSPRPWYLVEIPLLLIGALLALVKFNFTLQFIAVGGLVILVRALRGDIAGTVRITLLGLGSWLFWWILAGQSLTEIPLYFYGALQIAAGYGSAMAHPPSAGLLPFALIGIASFLSYLALGLRDNLSDEKSLRQRLAQILQLHILPLGLGFLAWKHGFTRADDGHIETFIAFLPFAFLPACWAACGDGIKFRFPVLRQSLTGLAILAGIALGLGVGSIHWFNWPGQSVQRLAVSSGQLQRAVSSMIEGRSFLPFPSDQQFPEDDLPLMRAHLGDEPVDLFNHQAGAALMNGLNLRSRPVIQSYSAYTQWLQRRNVEFLFSDSAPNHLIRQQETIDARHPMLDDAAAQIALLNNFQPILREHQYILFERAPDVQAGQLSPLPEGTVSWDWEEWIAVPPTNGGFITFHPTIRPSLIGKVLSFLYQPPEVWIELMTHEDQIRRFRFVPSMAQDGLIVNPLMESAFDLIKFYAGNPSLEVTHIRFLTSPRGKRFFKKGKSLFWSRGYAPDSAIGSAADEFRLLYPQYLEWLDDLPSTESDTKSRLAAGGSLVDRARPVIDQRDWEQPRSSWSLRSPLPEQFSDPIPGGNTWHSSRREGDWETGTITFPIEISEPGFLIIPYTTGPVSERQRIRLTHPSERTVARLTPEPTPSEWRVWILFIPQPPDNPMILLAEDNGTEWGEWMALAKPFFVPLPGERTP